MGETAKVLSRLLAQSGAHVFDYADRYDFDTLWASLDDHCHDLAGNVVVICWSRTAADPSVAPVVTGIHITPLDWAACAAAKCIDVQVAVVDLDPERHRESNAVTLYAQLDQSRLPWLRIIQPADLAVQSLDGLQVLFSPREHKVKDSSPRDFLALRRAVLTAPHSLTDRHAITNLIGPMVLLRRRHEQVTGHSKALWHLLEAAGLASARNEEPSAADPRDLAGLREQAPVRIVLLDDQWHHGWAEWVGWCLGLPWDSERADQVRACSPRDPTFLLGSSDSGVSLWVSGTADWLLDRLDRALAVSDAEAATTAPADARFRLCLTDESAGADEILLFDLRLFPPDGAAAKEFIRRAMPLVRRFLATDTGQNTSLPWPGFFPSEVARLEQWAAWAGALRAVVYSRRHEVGLISPYEVACGVGPVSKDQARLWRETVEVADALYVPIGETGDSRLDVSVGEVIEFQVSEVIVERSSGKQSLRWTNARAMKRTTEPPTPLSDVLRHADANDPAAALTVLPRLTALADMSLPIVLFSSTGRRDIAAKLDGYESVVTRFSKPRFFGDAANLVDESARALSDALREAATILRGRQRILEVQRPALSAGHARKYAHAALFLDESGGPDEKWFTVGGVLALFQNEKAELAFNDSLRSRGIHWGPQGLPKFYVEPVPGESPAERDARQQEQQRQQQEAVDKVMKAAEKRDVGLRAVVLAVEHPPSFTIDEGQAWPTRHLDYLHRVLVRRATEAVLFHLIGESEMEERWTFALLTDVRALPEHKLPEDTVKILKRKYGVWPEPHDPLARKWRAATDLAKLVSIERSTEAQELVKAVEAYRARNVAAARDAEHNWRVPFLGRNSIFPILDDLLHQYEGVQRAGTIVVSEAQACHLPEGKQAALNYPNRSLHFLADWVVGAVRQSLHGGTLAKWANDLLRAGLLESFDKDTIEHLRFARHAMVGEIGLATSMLIGHPRIVMSKLKTGCATLVVDALQTAPGRVFVDACRRAEVLRQREREAPYNRVAGPR